VTRALLQTGLECGQTRFKGPDLFGLLLEAGTQLDDQLLYDERRLFPAGCVQGQPFWQKYGGGHDSPSRSRQMTAWWALDAPVIEKRPEKFQRKVAGLFLAVTIGGCRLNNYLLSHPAQPA
jgi:hypothetical protein